MQEASIAIGGVCSLRESVDPVRFLVLRVDMHVFTSDVHLCLTVGGTVVRRGERPLRRHLGEVNKPSRGRGCLRTDLEAVGQRW